MNHARSYEDRGVPTPSLMRVTYRIARRIVIGVVGFATLAIGIILLATPGPGLLVIPLGLGILALEFGWARRWLRWVRQRAARGRRGIGSSRRGGGIVPRGRRRSIMPSSVAKDSA